MNRPHLDAAGADRQGPGLAFADWLEHRFPDPRGRSAQERVRARLRVRLPLAAVIAVLVRFLLNRVLDRYLQGSAPADAHPALAWVGDGAMVVGFAAMVLGLVRWWRAGRNEPSPYARTALLALTRREGRELSAELFGSRPAPPEDGLVLRHLARLHLRNRHLTVALSGMGLFFAGGALVTGGLLFAVLAIALPVAGAVYLARRRSQAEAYLRRIQTGPE